ncbi:MAG: hypothetical protein ABFS56_22885 [Pseudomonadota bacterium]
MAFSPDGKTALSGSKDTTTRLWNLETGKEIIRLVGFKDGESVAIMPQQGNYAASPKTLKDMKNIKIYTTALILLNLHYNSEMQNVRLL